MKDLIEGIHYYLSEDGLIVLTEKYHLEKAIAAAMAAGIVHLNMRMYPSRGEVNY